MPFDKKSFFLIAGPCVVEREAVMDEVARELSRICKKLAIPYIFKASYRKANRTKKDSFTGIGDIAALKLLRKIGDKYQLPILTDIHTEEEAEMAAAYVDVVQIPAFLCRQTGLLEAAARTGKIVNIKKGQFLSPGAMRFAVEKVQQAGGRTIWVTERGTTFGYNDLVVDYRGIPVMKAFAPTIVDCTHSLQQPNQSAGVTGGHPQFIATIAKAAIAAGADGIFIETHPHPQAAKSDGANMLALSEMEALLEVLLRLKKALD